MITNFKIYERVWTKNIKIGEIYKIESMILAQKGYATNIPLGRIVSTFMNNSFLDIKTYTTGNHDEYIIEDTDPKYLKRKATPEEIQEFEAIENSEKYNL